MSPSWDVLFPPSPEFRFGDWPNRAVPRVAAGVYTVWRGDEFIYVGMAGRGLSVDALKVRSDGRGGTGLRSRLASHASGRRSGDQFCVYVADRLVLGTLSMDEVAAVACGEHSMDALVRAFIHAQLTYRYVVLQDGADAYRLERELRMGCGPPGCPRLNPAAAQ